MAVAKNFDDLVERAKADWSDDARRVYEAASRQFAVEMDGLARLGAEFTAARTARHLTPEALAALSGLQPSEINRIECGVGNPTAATLLRLAHALGQRVVLVPGDR